MSTTNTTNNQTERFRQQFAEQVRQAQIENERRIEQARQAKDQRIRSAEREAEARLADATFRQIFYTHDNVIHTYRPDRSRSVLFTEARTSVTRPVAETPQGAARIARLQADLRVAEDQVREYEATLMQLEFQIAADEATAASNPFGNLFGFIPNARRSVDHRRRDDLRRTLEGARRRLASIQSELEELGQASSSETVPVNAAVGDVVVDQAGGAAYWARWAAPFAVSRHVFDTNDGSTDGTSEAIYDNRPAPVTSVALYEPVDGSEPVLYWLEGDRSIMRGSIDGSSAPDVVLDIEAPGQGGLWQLAIDSIQRRLYWTNTISIWRADLNVEEMSSTVVMVISPSESPHPIDLAVDGASGVLYWIDRDLKMLRSADLEGRDISDLYPIERPFRGLDVDRHTGMLYWADEVRGSRWVRRGATDNRMLIFDGSTDFVDLGRVIVSEPGRPASITIDLRFDVTEFPTGADQTLISRCSSDGTIHFSVALRRSDIVLTMGDETLGAARMSSTGVQDFTIALEDKPNGTGVQILNGDGGFGGAHMNSRLLEPARSDDPADGRWLLGAAHGARGPKQFFEGAIWEANVWSGAKTERQMRNIRRRIVDPATEKGLIGAWRGGKRIGRLLPNQVPGGTAGLTRSKRFDHRFPVEALALEGPDEQRSRLLLPPISLSANQGFTFEAWVMARSGFEKHTLLDLHDTASGQRLTVSLEQSSRQGDSEPIPVQVTGHTVVGETAQIASVFGGRVRRDRWVHVAVAVGPDGKPAIFIDGQEVRTSGGNKFPRLDLRAAVGEAGSSLQGMISDLRLWSGRIGNDLILRRRHQRLAGNEPGLVDYWPLEERQGAALAANRVGAGREATVLAVPEELRLIRAELRAAIADLEGAMHGRTSPQEQQRLDSYREELAAFNQQILEFDPWVIDEAPIARPDVVERQAGEVMSIPGSDGLALSFTAAYGIARKQQAQAALRLAREKADADVAAANASAAARRDLLEAGRASALFNAAETERQARSAATRRRAIAAEQRTEAREAGQRREEAATASATAIVDRSRSTAAGVVSDARAAKQQRVGKARSDRDRKAQELREARARL